MDELTGTISEILIYPIKSCAPVPLRQGRVTELGLDGDRRWVIVDSTGLFLTQRQVPHLALIEPELDTDLKTLSLSGPEQPKLTLPWADDSSPSHPVRVWKDSVLGLDMGDQAARWLDNFLQIPGRNFRLIQFDPRHARVSDTYWTGKDKGEFKHAFTDGFAINVLSRQAVTELNTRLEALGLEPVSHTRFRANIILDGIPAHEEDLMESMQIATRTGALTLDLVKPCTRCSIPEVDPYTAIREPRISEVLAEYRRNPAMDHAICFGCNAIVRNGAGQLIRTGDKFSYQLRF